MFCPLSQGGGIRVGVRRSAARDGAWAIGLCSLVVVSFQPGNNSNPYASEAYLQQLLQKAIAAGARDVHLKVGQPPGARVRGSLVFFRVDKVRAEDTEAVARHLIRDEKVLAELSTLREYDTSYSVPGIGRFRVNVYR